MTNIHEIYNNTDLDINYHNSYIELFEHNFHNYQNKNAIIFKNIHITYAELNEASNKLANYLLNYSVKPNSRIGIYLDECPEMITSILSILKCSASFVPMPDIFPAERVNDIAENAQIRLLLTKRNLIKIENKSINYIYLDEIKLDKYSSENIPLKTNLEDCIYNIYTSGSTGKPKGVSLSNKNILNFSYYIINKYEITKNDNFSKFAGFGFDASIIEIMPSLVSGACLHILDKETKNDIYKLNQYFEENNITICFLPTQFAELFMEEIDNKSLRCLYTGGEKLKKAKLRNYKICNIYGPTETTVAATFYEVIDENIENIPIGKPIDNYKVYIVNSQNNLCDVGEEGELWIAGEGVGLGYIDLPKLNSEKFIKNPFQSGSENKKYNLVYRTGDLAKWLSDGNIEYIGRIDFQVKIRGFRIELGEIEQKLIHYPNIKETTVLALKDNIGQDFLCAYYTAEDKIENENDINDILKKTLPEYMLPRYYVWLKQFPINANGKVDRKALPFPTISHNNSESIILPTTEQEKTIVNIVKDIFKLEFVSLSANFIALGGNSLKALLLLAKIRNQYDLKINDILNSSNLKEISDKLIIKTHKIEIIKQNSNEYLATYSQKGIYFSWQLDKSSTVYNTSVSLEIKGLIDQKKLEQTINTIIQEQRILRTNFVIKNENVYQINKEYKYINLDVENITELEIEFKFQNFIKPFDLENENLIRFKLFTCEKNVNYLLIDIHHIINDGYSQNLLVNEIFNRYSDHNSILNKNDYLDFSVYQSDMNKIKVKEFWQKQITNIEQSALPFDFPEVYFSHKGNTISKNISSNLTENIEKYCQTHNITEYCLYLAAFIVLNYKVARKNLITVGGFFAGRYQENTQNMLGMFVSTLPIITRISNNLSITEFLKNVQKNLNAILDNQDISLGEIIEESNLSSENGRNPFFSNAFNFVELNNYENKDLKIKNLNLFLPEQCHFDLTALLFKIEGTYEIRFEYNVASYKTESINSYITSYLEILSSMLNSENIKDINFISQIEKNKILSEFNLTNKNFDFKNNYIEHFHSAVEKYPNKNALVYKDTKLTYSELNSIANNIAKYLKSKNVSYKNTICLYFNESIEMIAAIIGVMKTSANFIPIADTFPKERIYEIFNDSNAKFILTNSDLFQLNFSSELNTHNIVIIDWREYFQTYNFENPIIETTQNDCLYSIYTSGSTGKPKGVSISNLNVVNFSKHLTSSYTFTSTDEFTKIAGYSFDASILEIMPCFIIGGCLHIIPKEIKTNIEKLNNYFTSNKITISFLPTQFAELFMKEVQNTSLRYLILGGDRLKKVKLHNYKVLNGYGPTETTVACSIYEVTDELMKHIPIGKPISNYKIYIADEDNNLCPIGVPGELYIAGLGVAIEYINLPKLNAEKFIKNPFISSTDENYERYQRIYKSGDLAKWNDDGNIEFIGRIDSQVKIRGYRIELSEIEQRLLELENISECVVLPLQMENDHTYLCAYYVGSNEIIESEIKKYLLQYLPEYMVPESYYYMPVFPINQSGKIDKKKLPLPTIQVEEQVTLPETENERKLYTEFKKVLQIENFGIDSNFFRIGGNSLKAVQIVTHLAKEFDIEVSDIFHHKTIRNVAKNIKKSNLKYEIRKTNLQKYPLPNSQKGIYLASIIDPESTIYNIPLAIEINGRLNKDKLGDAIDKLIQNNRILRSYFLIENNDIFSKIDDNFLLKKDFQKSKIQELELLMQEFIKPFHLENTPLIRIKLVQIESNQFILFIDTHHIINDGFSQNLILNEIFDYYFENKTNLHENKIDYFDYAIYNQENEYLKKQSLLNWKNIIDKIEKSYLPFDYPEKIFSDNGDIFKVKIENSLFMSINVFCQNNSLTLYSLSLATYFILLYKVTRRTNLTIGGFFTGRHLPEMQNMLGMFVSTLPIYLEVDSNLSNLEFLHKVQDCVSDIMKQQNISIDELAQLSNLNASDGRNKFFNNAFNFLEKINTCYNDLSVNILPIKGKNKAHFDLTINCIKDKNEIEISFEYSLASYKKESIIKYADCYLNILQDLVNQEGYINNINFISNSDKELILESFNPKYINRNYDNLYIERFNAIASKYPNNSAIVLNDKTLLYSELNNYSNRVANYLIANGVTKHDKIVLYVSESVEMISLIIAILKTGASFIPVADSFPVNRVEDILQDSSAKYLLSNLKKINELNFQALSDLKVIDISTINLEEYNSKNIPLKNLQSDFAYHIYTSGSTGKPKGVSITHKNIINLCEYVINLLKLNSEDNFSKYAGFSFDASIIEILPALISGACIHIIDKKLKLDPIELNNYFEKNKITNCFLPTQFAEIFMQETSNKSLNNLITGGEKLKKILKKNYKIFNQYGPSETTVVATSFLFDGNNYTNIPIGKSIENFAIYIADPDMNLCPIGVSGELCIAGDGVGSGYIGLPELNQQKFIANPFSNKPYQQVLYKTGDLAQWLPDGNIEFHGRIDFQVKIRGFRIELGEIETQLSLIPEINECLVLPLQDESKQDFLCAYYTAKEKIADKLIQQFLANKLPEYMIPEIFHWMSEFPINSSGKVDRKNFPKPRRNIETIYVAPRNEKEKFIAQAFSEILNITEPSIYCNFFQNGGNSLKAVQLVTIIQQKYDVKISDIFQHKDIENIACNLKEFDTGFNIDFRFKEIKKMLQEPFTDTQLEATKDPELNYQVKLNELTDWQPKSIRSKQCVLILGASGFLGCHILLEELRKTENIIYVIIRKKGQNTNNTFFESLNHYAGQNKLTALEQERIHVLHGDIATNNFSLAKDEYKVLQSKIHLVINCAANVKHYGEYSQFYQDNVQTVINIIDFCGENIKLHHISTYSVSMVENTEDSNSEFSDFFTEFDVRDSKYLDNYYLKTKAEAEQIIVNKNSLNANIYRVGNLVFNTETNLHQINIDSNGFYQKVKCLLNIDSLCEHPAVNVVELSPVNNTASAIVLLSQQENLNKEIFHVYNSKMYKLTDIFSLKQDTKRLDINGVEEFIDKIALYYKHNYTKELLNNFLLHMGWINLTHTGRTPIVKNEKTNLLLDKLQFQWDEIKTQHFEDVLDNAYKNRITELTRLQPFLNLERSTLHFINNFSKLRIFEENEIVLSPNSKNKSVFIILDGFAQLSIKSKMGGWISSIGVLSSGDFIGIENLFSGFSSNLIVDTIFNELILLEISENDFIYLKNNKDIFETFFKYIIESINNKNLLISNFV
ncbi:amino acid adenylation domain-containing protein [Pigmentibacter sp. JX0631]|uniref:non-ribosomal peptide synthetase n=1 Tax=Pigmentibacter sp. JX0631 TaxID=2976982 RepID=UPI002469437A|nr:non-ribosomal peptide synthetase [Pigmentibacter sp. JX0631]WGL60023.1 amino acid adenylation domain-containing protein [Pigmentibacter sp. JX0631]